MPRTLIVYYSHTGTTRRVAENIASAISAPLEIITEARDRRGFINYVRSGKEALFKEAVAINPILNDPADFDLVVLGSPV